MSENTKIVRVFIASPGGLEDERRAAREIVHEVNQANSEHWRCLIKLVGWEDTIPGYQRPQSLINVDLDKCQYFIGILWNRWGTKPDLDKSGFTSGFEEEFCRAEKLSAAGTMKDIVLYFKAVDVPDGLEPGPDIRKVKAFRAKCIDEKRIFFRDFADTVDFRDLVRQKVTEIGWREFKLHTALEVGNSEAEQSPQRNVGEHTPTDTNFFDREALDFISAMSSRTSDREQTSPYEVARFRLIAASLRRAGNDELYLGNHDANLIFRHRNEISLSWQEVRALIACGVAGFDHQNVPLWRWLVTKGTSSDPFERIKALAVLGNTEEQRNSIRLLQILGITSAELDPHFGRDFILADWLNSEGSGQVFDVAAQFLSFNGTQEDIEVIGNIYADAPADKKLKLDAIVASILTRYSHEDSLRFICSRSVEKISETFVDVIFSRPVTLPTELLTKCLAVKSDGIRLRAVKLLIQRGELADSEAHNLLSDSNHEIRLLAVECLQGRHPLPSETVKAVLTVRKSGAGFGLFHSAETDSSFYDRYLKNRLRELELEQLKVKVAEAGLFNEKELLTLYEKFSKKLAADLRANLHNQFVEMLENSLRKIESSQVSGKQYRAQVYQIWDYYQRGIFSGALAILCKMKAKTDIGLVRSTLDTIEVELSPELLTYLTKFGDWSDVVRIGRLASPSNYRPGLLDFSFNLHADEKAAAIFELGKNRIADLLDAELSSSIKKSLIKIFPKNVFASLSNNAIISELDRKDDDYRIIFALRCVETLPRERIETILDLYVQRDTQRYYNSIHWLDLGASFPKKQASAIVRRELVRRSH